MRASLAVALVAALAACASDTSRGPDPARRVAPSTAPTTTTLLPSAPYAPAPGEVAVEIKAPAARLVQLLTTYDAAGSTVEAVRQRLAAAGTPPVFADKAQPLIVAGANSTGDIVYPQLGGVAGSRASVMVVVRQRLLLDGRADTVTRTIDVRLSGSGGAWRAEDVVSVGGDAVVVPPRLSAAARRVLDHSRILLPDSARWDIHAGRVTDRVLTVLADLADQHDVGVTVLSSGHPQHVFGTSSISNHTRGRAVDLWLVDRPVVEQRDPRGPLRPLLDDLLHQGVTELGSPFDVDGAGGRNFANLVHQDHLHVGFDAA